MRPRALRKERAKLITDVESSLTRGKALFDYAASQPGVDLVTDTEFISQKGGTYGELNSLVLPHLILPATDRGRLCVKMATVYDDKRWNDIKLGRGVEAPFAMRFQLRRVLSAGDIRRKFAPKTTLVAAIGGFSILYDNHERPTRVELPDTTDPFCPWQTFVDGTAATSADLAQHRENLTEGNALLDKIEMSLDQLHLPLEDAYNFYKPVES